MTHQASFARRLIAGILILTTGTGCLTQRLWEQANDSPVSFGQIVGVGESKAEHRRWLVVRYGADGGAPVLRIPLDVDGRPLPPFAWIGGTLPPGRGFFDQVTDAQRRQIDETAVLQPAGKDGSVSEPDHLIIDFATDPTLVLAAYRFTPDGRLESVKLPAAAVDSDQPWTPFGPDVRVVVLPLTRSDTVRSRNKKLAAAALTPLTAVADATVVLVVVGIAGGVIYCISRFGVTTDGTWFQH